MSPETLTVDVWWKGTVPAALRRLRSADPSVTLRIHPGQRRRVDLEVAEQRLLDAWQIAFPAGYQGVDLASVSHRHDGAGLIAGFTFADRTRDDRPASLPPSLPQAVESLSLNTPVTSYVPAYRARAAVGRAAR